MTITPPISLAAVLPELCVLLGGCAVLLMGQAGSAAVRRQSPWVALLSLAAALAVAMLSANASGGWLAVAGSVGSGLAIGSLVPFVRISALELGILLTLANWSGSRDRERGEFLSMMLFSLCGLLLVAACDNLLLLFLALELVSIPTYVMVVLSRTHARALEAGTKYFYLGALSAAVMGYGFSFLYGVAETASISAAAPVLAEALEDPATLRGGLAVVGLVLAVGGVLFKLAAFPMHFYVADVYQGASSPVAGLLGFVPKLAGVLALFKLLGLTYLWTGESAAVFWLVWIVALLSMTVGNVLALRQTNIKRMLAYSGVAHAGYMLVGVLAGPDAGSGVHRDGIAFLGDGTAAVLYYVVVYGIANLGAFAVLGLLRQRGAACETLRDVAGLMRREPALALLLALAMFTLMGLPPAPGFWGKLGLFGSALAAAGDAPAGFGYWLVTLVVLAVLNSALAAAYYLRVIAAVLVYENDRPAASTQREAEHIGALLSGFMILIFAFYPNVLLSPSQVATRELREAVQVSLEHREQVRAGPEAPLHVETRADLAVSPPAR